MTPEQIVDLDLTTRPTKRSDSRANSWMGGFVEAEVTPALVLRDIVESVIVGQIDREQYEQPMAVEEFERLSVLDFAAEWRGAS